MTAASARALSDESHQMREASNALGFLPLVRGVMSFRQACVKRKSGVYTYWEPGAESMTRFMSVSVIALLSLFATIRICAQETLPKDINPDSRNRLPLIKRADLDDAGKKAYDAAVASFAGAPQAMGAEIRLHGTPGIIPQTESPLGMPLMQLAILITGREHDQPYEWSLHEMQALAVSLDPAVIDVIRRSQPTSQLGDK